MIDENFEQELADTLSKLREVYESEFMVAGAMHAEVLRCNVYSKLNEIMSSESWKKDDKAVEQLAILVQKWIKAIFYAASTAGFHQG